MKFVASHFGRRLGNTPSRRDPAPLLIGILGQALGVTPKMEFLPLQPGDVPATYADITQIQNKCGYHPTTPISIGIPKFVEWYKSYKGILPRRKHALSPSHIS